MRREGRTESRCRLCGTTAVLIESHLVPRGVYGRIQNAFCGSKKDLVQVNPSNGTAALDSRQLKEFLLCKRCENRFKEREDYFYELIDSEDRSWISKASRLTGAALSGLRMPAIDLTDARIDVPTLAYFVLSVLWRCNVSSRTDLASYRNSFGMKFANEVEQYLLGLGSFPNKCFVKLTAYDNEYAFALLSGPSVQKHRVGGDRFHIHMIHFLGITFEVFRGGRENLFPKDRTLPCYGRVSCQEKVFEESALFSQLGREIRDVERKGRLTKLYPVSNRGP